MWGSHWGNDGGNQEGQPLAILLQSGVTPQNPLSVQRPLEMFVFVPVSFHSIDTSDLSVLSALKSAELISLGL